MGVRLVQRTTRSFSLTEEGQLVRDRFQEMADTLADIEESLKRPSPAGVLRITAPYSFTMNMIAPVIAGFLAGHSEVTVSVDLSNRRVDLVSGEFDLALRAGWSENTALIGRKLGDSLFVLCASPGYLAAAAPLDRPEDLARHAILAFHHEVETLRSWTLRRADERVTVEFTPRLAANDHAILLRAALDGAGITCVPRRLVRDHLDAGRLVRCMPDWHHGDAEVFALCPSRRGLSAKLRAFIDHLTRELDFSC